MELRVFMRSLLFWWGRAVRGASDGPFTRPILGAADVNVLTAASNLATDVSEL
jgi:hypothetical protein